MELLRNLPLEAPEALAGLIDIQPGRVVSMALSRSDHCQMTLLAFGDGESVSEERYFGDTLYVVLEGAMPLVDGAQTRTLARGDCLAVPAGVTHAIGGAGPFKLLQITLQ